jgi:ATP-dependent protease ClpP protease subunit
VKYFVYVILALISACAGVQHAVADAPPVTTDRTVVLSGPILQGNIFGLLPHIAKMAANNREPINIIIDSPGGGVVDGSLFINELRALQGRDIKVRCYVVSMAASMAFQILANCTERYTLDRAVLLWHRVSASGIQSLTGPQARTLAKDLSAIDGMILRELYAKLDMPKEDVLYHLNVETLHFGENLARLAPEFISSFATIPGLVETFHDPKTPRMAKPRTFLDVLFDGSRTTEYMYIWRNAAK